MSEVLMVVFKFYCQIVVLFKLLQILYLNQLLHYSLNLFVNLLFYVSISATIKKIYYSAEN